jgi:hypothetical protein
MPKRTMITRTLLLTLVFGLTIHLQLSWAQKKGATATIHQGIVVKAEQTQLKSGAAKGALVGGTVGLATSRGKSSSKKTRNTIIGAGVGGAAKAASEGDRMAMAYTVKVSDSSMISVVTDQTELRIGDCVAVEQRGDMANIRRLSPAACGEGSKEAVKELEEEFKEEADECLDAKQLLLAAGADDDLDLLIRKIKILCDH